MDSQLFSEFKAWKEESTFDRSCCFLERVYREDIYPCLTFSKSEVQGDVGFLITSNAIEEEYDLVVNINGCALCL